MSEPRLPDELENLNVRPYKTSDQNAVKHLYTAGLLAGQIAPNDTGADINNIQEAYFDQDRHHFWVAEVENWVRGMIGLASDEPHTAEIRRLRVEQGYQHMNIAPLLLETAISHCKRHGYLKVRLDTRFERNAAVGMFDRAGFEHTRTKSIHSKEQLEFYLDLYRAPTQKSE